MSVRRKRPSLALSTKPTELRIQGRTRLLHPLIAFDSIRTTLRQTATADVETLRVIPTLRWEDALIVYMDSCHRTAKRLAAEHKSSDSTRNRTTPVMPVIQGGRLTYTTINGGTTFCIEQRSSGLWLTMERSTPLQFEKPRDIALAILMLAAQPTQQWKKPSWWDEVRGTPNATQVFWTYFKLRAALTTTHAGTNRLLGVVSLSIQESEAKKRTASWQATSPVLKQTPPHFTHAWFKNS